MRSPVRPKISVRPIATTVRRARQQQVRAQLAATRRAVGRKIADEEQLSATPGYPRERSRRPCDTEPERRRFLRDPVQSGCHGLRLARSALRIDGGNAHDPGSARQHAVVDGCLNGFVHGQVLQAGNHPGRHLAAISLMSQRMIVPFWCGSAGIGHLVTVAQIAGVPDRASTHWSVISPVSQLPHAKIAKDVIDTEETKTEDEVFGNTISSPSSNPVDLTVP